MLGRWENGDPVSERYQTLFCAVYRCDPVELGFSAASIGDLHRVTAPRPNAPPDWTRRRRSFSVYSD
jgi:hypothetical protein